MAILTIIMTLAIMTTIMIMDFTSTSITFNLTNTCNFALKHDILLISYCHCTTS